jgi:hypothetical protein
VKKAEYSFEGGMDQSYITEGDLKIIFDTGIHIIKNAWGVPVKVTITIEELTPKEIKK